MAVIYSYKLKRPCGNMRPFCRKCTNTFSIDSCGAGNCGTHPPSSFCLVADRIHGVIIPCTECKDRKAPSKFQVTIALPAGGPVYGPFVINNLIAGCLWEGQFNLPGIPDPPPSFFGYAFILQLGITANSQVFNWGGGSTPVLQFRYQLSEDVTVGDGCLRSFIFPDSFAPSTGGGVVTCLPIYD